MSDTGFPKFGWMAHVAEDDQLSDAQARVLIYIANQYVRGSDDWFCVRQQTVADKLHKRRQTVGEALRRGRELGHLKLAAERYRGRGWHQADVYQLTSPEIGARGSTSSEKYVRVEDEIGARGGPEYVRVEDEIGAFDARQNTVSPAVCDGLQGVGTGLRSTGLKLQGAASELFGGILGRNSTETPALEAPKPVPVRSTRPLADDERCPHHDTPDPGCAICRAFARARGELL
jgi:hypothetical protein